MNRKHFTTICAAIVTTASLLWAPGAHAVTATIEVGEDNTIAEEFPDRSAGLCESLFGGYTDPTDPDTNPAAARRALLQFDLSAIPAGSTINSVTLNLTVTRPSNRSGHVFSLHPITTAWTEGTNTCPFRGGGKLDDTGAAADGVTWNTMLTFGAASASTSIDNTSPSWTSAQLAADLQTQLDGGNVFGWILIGDETAPTSTRRFDSFQGGAPPQLVVDFTTTGDTEACCDPVTGGCILTNLGECTDDPQGVGTTCEPNLCDQPTGACCNADNTCSDTDPLTCEGAGGTFVGGNCNQADCGLTPFVEALPIPPIKESDGTNAQGHPTYTITVEEATQSVHPDLPNTTLWTYNGAWPSSTIVATKDQPIEVTYENNLPNRGNDRGSSIVEVDTCAHGPNDWGNAKRISTHLHGGHLPARFDGQPEFTILPGETDVYQYPNNQDAGTVWYHDHALGITRLNVYAGMAGFYLIRDEYDTLGIPFDPPSPNALDLPSGTYEIGLAVQDRTFDADGSLFYNAQLEDAFKGEYVVVNGKVNPYLMVDQGKYRFRLLNGSQSREYIYRLECTSQNCIDQSLPDPTFTLIGTDLGLIDGPIDLGNTTGGVVGPAERLDVVIDFEGYPAGTEIILRNDDPTLPLLPSIMKFIVTDQQGHINPLPSTLRAVTPLDPGTADETRYFRLVKEDNVPCQDGSTRTISEWLIESLDGPGGNVTAKHWDDIEEYPILGNREIWEFENVTNSYHPMHVHLVKFQILGKTDLTTGQAIPLQPWEVNTWKDIVHVPPNSSARIIMDFEDYAGRFPTHCHLLDHEDHEMMRQFQASYDPANCNNNGTCELGEDCESCPNDCAQVSGASCGNGLCEAGDGENCANCPDDCAGRQKGNQNNQFCCGVDDGQVNNPVGCDRGGIENRCIDSAAGLACRDEDRPRVSACCGDALCEGAEDIASCAVDCDPNACQPSEFPTEVTCDDGEDNDCDGLVDAADPDCQVTTTSTTSTTTTSTTSTSSTTTTTGPPTTTTTSSTTTTTTTAPPDPCGVYGKRKDCVADAACTWTQGQCVSI